MLRLRVYLSNPQGERLRILPVLKDTIQYAHPLNGSAVLKFALSSVTAGRMPEEGFVVSVEYKWGTGNYQALPEHSLFFMSKANGDDADQSKVVTYEGETYITWLLALTYLHWSSSAKNGERIWVEPGDKPASSGWIMHGMLTESQARGWGDQVSWDFTGSADSKGNPWTSDEKVKQGWRLLDPISSVLGALSESGLCDWTVEGRTLRLFRTGKLGVDRSQWVVGGPRMTRVPIKTDASKIFTHLTVVPEKARNWLYLENPGAPSEHGRLEATMTQSGIESHSEATRLAQPALKLGAAPQREESYEWTPDGDMAPWAHFRVGDMVTVRVQGKLIQRRVIAVIVEARGGVMVARVTVGEKIPGMQARILGLIGAGHVGSIIGGSGKAFPGSAGPLRPEPARVEGLLVVNDVARWTEDGKLISEVTLGWDPVVYAVDGTAIDLTGYELWARAGDGPRYRLTSTGDTEVTTTAIEPGTTRRVSVRAISDQGVAGAFSTEVEVTPQPPEPLDPPTQPTFRTGNGAVQTIWDGQLDAGDGPYPAPVWCSHCLVEVQEDGETSWTRFPQDSGWVLTGLARGDKWQVRLVAVDFRGIESEPGPAGEVTVASEAQDALERANQAAADALEAKQEAQETANALIDMEGDVQTALTGGVSIDRLYADGATFDIGVIDTLVSDQGFISRLLTQQIIVAGDNMIRDPAFKKPLAENWVAWEGSIGDWYTSTSSWAPGATVNCEAGGVAKRIVQIARIPVIPGQTLSVAFRGQAGWSGNPWVGTSPQVRIAWRSSTGIISSESAYVTPNAGWLTINKIMTAPSDEALLDATIELYITPGATSGLLSLSQLMVRSGVGATLIEPDAVTTPAIKAGSIITDHLSVGALDAFAIRSPLIESSAIANRGLKWNGTILSGYNNSGVETFRLDATRATITAGIFRTTATSNRGIQMDADFLRAWDASGSETFRMTASTGAVVLTGATFRSAASGQRLQLDTTGLRAFNASGSEVARLSTDDLGFRILSGSKWIVLGVGGDSSVSMGQGQGQASINTSGGHGSVVLLPNRSTFNGAITLDSSVGMIEIQNATSANSTLGGLWITGMPTTTAGSNVVCATNPNGRFYRSTSLRKYKKDLRPLGADIDPYQILNVLPQTWLDSGQLEMQATLQAEADAIAEARADGVMVIDPDYEPATITPRRIPGFVAEDMEAAGLGVLCEYDEHDELQGISYDRVGAALVLALTALLERVETLEAALAA